MAHLFSQRVFFFIPFNLIWLASSLVAQTVNITVDGAATGTPLKPIWSWYGYDEANYTVQSGDIVYIV